jgi:hypothetical protein
MIKTSKQRTLTMEIKLFQKSKVCFSHIPLKFHVLQWYNGTHLFLFSKDIPQQKIVLCSIQIQMVIKNYVI